MGRCHGRPSRISCGCRPSRSADRAGWRSPAPACACSPGPSKGWSGREGAASALERKRGRGPARTGPGASAEKGPAAGGTVLPLRTGRRPLILPSPNRCRVQPFLGRPERGGRRQGRAIPRRNRLPALRPSGLGGLDQVRWLAEGLVDRGHQVTLIGADLGLLSGGGYQVVDTDPAGGHRASPQAAERWHAEQAGKVLEYLAGMDVEVVSDPTRSGWLPAGGASVDLPTVQTRYQPLEDEQALTHRAGHLGD